MVPRVREYSIQHKDLIPVVYVTGDMARELDSPLYGLFDIRASSKGFTASIKAMPSYCVAAELSQWLQ